MSPRSSRFHSRPKQLPKPRSSVWQPDDRTRQLRAWLTHRKALMTQRARLKNQVQGLLGRLLIASPFRLLWTKKGVAWLHSVELPTHERLVLKSQLRQLVIIEQEIKTLDEQLAVAARSEPQVPLLMTIPGVNYVVALGLLAALGDISRFQDGDHAAAYLGLAPLTRQSGNRCYHGHITKAGSSQTRGLLTQSAQHASRHPGPIGAFFRRLVKRKNRNVAIVAVARKLVTIAFLMLKNKEPYRYARPALMHKKFTALKLLPSKSNGSLRVPKNFTGLDEIYRAVGLPAVQSPETLPKGEVRMLAERKLKGYIREIYRPIKQAASARKTSPAKTGRPAGRPR